MSNPYALHCGSCGKFVGYQNYVTYTLYGGACDLEPPDPEFECLPCWDEQDNKWRELTRRVSWRGPSIVRNGRGSIEPKSGGKKWLRWLYHIHYWGRVRYNRHRLLFHQWRARRRYKNG